MHYVYLLECQDDKSWYIGQTDDLRERVKRHNDGTGARTTSLRKNWELIYYEAYRVKADALGREKFLKSGSGYKYLKKQLNNLCCQTKIYNAL
jgi:putative endonuclease